MGSDERGGDYAGARSEAGGVGAGGLCGEGEGSAAVTAPGAGAEKCETTGCHGGAAVLVLALCWLAPHARPNFGSVAFDLEMVLVVELMGVAAWLGMRSSDG